MISLLLFSCSQGGDVKVAEKSEKKTEGNIKGGELIENIQTTNYTYLKLNVDDKEQWFAVGKTEVENGKKYYYNGEMKMVNFHSKELDRTFETIYFISSISENPEIQEPVHNHEHAENTDDITDAVIEGHTGNNEKANVKTEPAKDGITIEELFKNKDSYSGKTVKIRGKVVKVNNQIMNKNWVHIQDGTENAGNFDLTITTNENINLDETITFEGKITLNKDFGYGYSYKVIMEDAVKK